LDAVLVWCPLFRAVLDCRVWCVFCCCVCRVLAPQGGVLCPRVGAHGGGTHIESVVFYYGGAMTIGIFLLILIILFQVIYNPLQSALYSSSWTLQLKVGIGNAGWCHSCNGSIELTYCLIWNYHLDYGIFEDYMRICIGKILNQQYT